MVKAMYLILCALLVLPSSVSAQFNALSNNVSLDVEPRFPDPNTEVTVRVNDFALGAGTGAIDWNIDGEQVANLANARAITVPVGDIGDTTTIAAALSLASGQTMTIRKSITPTTVALIVEPQTSAPSWYAGRPLPSVGSSVRVVAFPETGGTQAADTYTYTWRLNNDVLFSGPVYGQRDVTITMPYGNQAIVTVTVGDKDNETLAQRSVAIPNHEPEIHFYTQNPLRGQSRLALPEQYPLLGSEMTVRAEPFHLSTTLVPADTLYEWKVNGRTVTNPSQDQQRITLRNDGGTGRFAVDFHIRNLEALLQGARGKFNVSF